MWENTETRFDADIRSVCSDHGLALQTFERTTEKTANTVFKLTLETGETKILKIYTFPHFENGMVRGAGGLQRTISKYSACVPEINYMGKLPTKDYVYHINEYIVGDSYTEHWRENTTPQTQHNLAAYCANILGQIHNIPEQFDIVGEVTDYNWEKESYSVRTDNGWRTTLETICERRATHARQSSPVSKEQTENLITTLENSIELAPEEIEKPVIGHNDLRVPNLIVKEDGTPVIVDWDNGFIGDWLYAYTMAEYMIYNKPSLDNSVHRSELKKTFRDEYFATVSFEQPETFPRRYWYYYGLKLLQELRSFNYWYQNHSETFRKNQADWLAENVDKVVAELQEKE